MIGKLLRRILIFLGSLVVLAFAGIVISLLFFSDGPSFGDGVGLVEVKGMIVDGQETVRQLHAFGKEERVRAVVLRIDSPGGVVGPSQEIYSEVKRLAAKKKVVVSMGSVAASGGYYIAAPASFIFANPGTITGSIGVLMKFTNVEGLMGKVGVKGLTLKSGRFKDSGSPLHEMTPEERQMLQGVIDSTYRQFVAAVAQGRRLPVEEVSRIADGRILSGEQALSLKLVDRLGTLQEAVEEAGRLAGMKGEPRVIKAPQKRRPSWDLLVQGVAERLALSSPRGVGVEYLMEGGGSSLTSGYLP
ncbi:signal peptide peptidase SppA [Geomonas sp. RF6]|uniref:signal peptide peptidase SppA n=1 Tax=Geomonas sp. RF6 TaxID=2897342 RepID=UPI001E2ED24B|nr:signal peptide peptidase SppA [Geomonas sp. RF6]UFS69249.1 signal peptide peptidase SppA [Geomonas sp. RF6]